MGSQGREKSVQKQTLLRLLSSLFSLTSAAIHGVAKSRTRLSDWTWAIFPQLLLFVQPSVWALWPIGFLGGLLCPLENLYTFILSICLQSVQFNRSVVFNSLRSHGLLHARPPCPSPTAGACSNSCSSSRWCHPTISLEAILHPNHKILFKLSCYKTVFALWVHVNNAILSFLELQAVEKC